MCIITFLQCLAPKGYNKHQHWIEKLSQTIVDQNSKVYKVEVYWGCRD